MMLGQECNNNGQEFDWIRGRLVRGLELLAIAYRYSMNSNVHRQEFAVTYGALREVGLNECDVRWMLTQGITEHLVELTLPGDKVRSFRSGGVAICSDSCLTLTEGGFAYSHQVVAKETHFCSTRQTNEFQDERVRASDNGEHPVWDPNRQELWFHSELVKRYRLPSPNQTAILSAFEEDNWPARIDDPLSPKSDQDPKRRLHDTIRNLNRSQQHPLVRFVGDGSGQGVLWERIR